METKKKKKTGARTDSVKNERCPTAGKNLAAVPYVRGFPAKGLSQALVARLEP